MQINTQRFWDKYHENRKAAHSSYLKGYYNVAASRYYYALRLAVTAFFKKEGIMGPTSPNRAGLMVEKWRHDGLISKAEDRLQNRIANIKDILEDAKDAREIGDYSQDQVPKRRIKFLMENSRIIFKVIWREIK